MSNPNHDERGRFAVGGGVSITGGILKGKTGILMEHGGKSGSHIVGLDMPSSAGPLAKRTMVRVKEKFLKSNLKTLNPTMSKHLAAGKVRSIKDKIAEHHAAREEHFKASNELGGDAKLAQRIHMKGHDAAIAKLKVERTKAVQAQGHGPRVKAAGRVRKLSSKAAPNPYESSKGITSIKHGKKTLLSFPAPNPYSTN